MLVRAGRGEGVPRRRLQPASRRGTGPVRLGRSPGQGR